MKARPVYFVAEHSVKSRAEAPQSRRRAHRRRMSSDGTSTDARADLAVRRRLRHFARRQHGDPRSRGARPAQRHLGDGGGAELLRAPRRRRSTCSMPAGARVAIGLHLTLTGPFKPLSAGLCAAARRRVPAAARRCLRAAPCCGGSTGGARARDRARSSRRSSTAFGRAPDFVDGHQHVHLFPQVREPLLEVVEAGWRRRPGCASAAASAPLRAAAVRPQGPAARLCSAASSARARQRSASPPIRRSPAPIRYRAGRGFRARCFPASSKGCRRAAS